MNEYSKDLKSKLEQVEDYVVHQDTPRMTNVFSDDSGFRSSKSVFTFKNFLWIIGIAVIGVSVVAFFTQAVLLVIDNAKSKYGSNQQNPNLIAGNTQNASGTSQSMYIRTDLDHPVFEPAVVAPATTTATTTTGTSTPLLTDVSVRQIPKSIELGIPGVTRIGYDDTVGDKVLTDNINKYSNNTLVLGAARDVQAGGQNQTIGGGDDAGPATDRYEELPKAVQPVLSSKAYLIADLHSGEIILEKNGDTIYPLASVSKLMTALVAREKMNMQDIAIVSRDASGAYGAQGSLALGEKIRLRDLLFPLLMESSNDAAEVFADQYGHARFMEEMNKKAVSLGMYDTYYGDPSGLDPQNTSNPKDMLTLARYIVENDPEIFDITRVKQFSIKGHTWNNANRLLPVVGFAGGKNGFIDQALQTTVSLFDIPLAKGGVRTVVIVVLKSNAKDADVAKLINYLKKFVEYRVE
ncbi:MAG: serine hydrolase [Patescibacteria group bacterium]